MCEHRVRIAWSADSGLIITAESSIRPFSSKCIMVNRGAAASPFGESSYFFGTNIPGKPRKYLLNSGGRPKLFAVIADVVANDYKAFKMS